MLFSSVSEQFKQSAMQDFERVHRHGTMVSGWSKVVGRERPLYRLDQVQRSGKRLARSVIGVKSVPIAAIGGSEGRSADFDAQWRPLKKSNRERWVNIAVARHMGVALPAIELVKVGELYFVLDGHHRISVARVQGQEEIEANIIEWQGAHLTWSPPKNSWLNLSSVKPMSYLNRRVMDVASALHSAAMQSIGIVAASTQGAGWARLFRPALASSKNRAAAT